MVAPAKFIPFVEPKIPGSDARPAVVRALIETGYQCIRSFEAKSQHGELLPETHFEFWGGRKGVIILQFWKGNSGIHCYADWPMGHTIDDLKAAL